jgi:CheY-like chemotaxis protein
MKRILFVDDIQDQAELLCNNLREVFGEDNTIEYADSAEKALDFYSKNFFHILILDLMMPPMKNWNEDEVKGGFLSGLKLHKEIISICNDKKWKVPKLIITTALDSAPDYLCEEAKAYFKQYMDISKFWLDKPYAPELLEEKVADLLQEE